MENLSGCITAQCTDQRIVLAAEHRAEQTAGRTCLLGDRLWFQKAALVTGRETIGDLRNKGSQKFRKTEKVALSKKSVVRLTRNAKYVEGVARSREDECSIQGFHSVGEGFQNLL